MTSLHADGNHIIRIQYDLAAILEIGGHLGKIKKSRWPEVDFDLWWY